MNIKDKLKNIKLLLLDVDGTMTDGGIYIDNDGKQFKKFNSQDGEGIRMAQDKGIKVGIVSAATSAKKIIETRAKMLDINLCYVNRSRKIDIVKSWANQLGFERNEIAYMGDDIIDKEVLEWVGLGAVPANANNSVLEIADYTTTREGGNAAVREFIDMILEEQK